MTALKPGDLVERWVAMGMHGLAITCDSRKSAQAVANKWDRNHPSSAPHVVVHLTGTVPEPEPEPVPKTVRVDRKDGTTVIATGIPFAPKEGEDYILVEKVNGYTVRDHAWDALKHEGAHTYRFRPIGFKYEVMATEDAPMVKDEAVA